MAAEKSPPHTTADLSWVAGALHASAPWKASARAEKSRRIFEEFYRKGLSTRTEAQGRTCENIAGKTRRQSLSTLRMADTLSPRERSQRMGNFPGQVNNNFLITGGQKATA